MENWKTRQGDQGVSDFLLESWNFSGARVHFDDWMTDEECQIPKSHTSN